MHILYPDMFSSAAILVRLLGGVSCYWFIPLHNSAHRGFLSNELSVH